MTWVGLDVHARSVHAAVLDAETGSCAARGWAARWARWWRAAGGDPVRSGGLWRT